MRSYLFRLINQVQRLDILPIALRIWLLKCAGVRFGGPATLFCGIDWVEGPLSIGKGAFINRGVLIEGPGGIEIGDLVHIGPGAQILTSTHEIGGSARRAAELRRRPVVIGAGSWIGAGAIVLPGVTVAPGTVVAAGSVVTEDTGRDDLYAGMPARRKRDLAAVGT